MGKGEANIVISDRLYVPLKAWKNIPRETRKSVVKWFKKVYVSPSTYCDLLQNNRHCINWEDMQAEEGAQAADELCKSCPMAKRKFVCAFKGNGYASFYRGDLSKVKKVISLVKKHNKGIELRDDRVLAPLKKRFSVTESGDSRSESQNKLARSYIKKGYGILVAAARFGKTRMAGVVAAELGQRTFVLAHQKELLEQFLSNWLKFTNIKPDQIKINPTEEEAKKIAVSLFTYQHFLQKHGRKRLKALRKVPGLVIVDEAHRCGAKGFNRTVNSFHAMYRLGITATPNRKDKASFLIYNTFGPVTAEGGVEMLSCDYKVVKTGVVFPDYDKVAHRRRFQYLQAAMQKDEERNGIIAKRAVRNVDKGHQVLIPLKGVAHVKEVAKLIRARMKKEGYRNARICEFSAAFVKGKAREETAQKIRDGYYDVVVAVESMINVGFDAPHMSNLVLNAGTYSFNNENRYQLFSRIRTKCEGKKKPLIDILSDDCKWSDFSLKATLAQMKEYSFTEVVKKKKKKAKAA